MAAVKALGYACLNTFSQQPKNLTLAFQESMISEFAAARGIDLVAVHREEIDSSGSGGRPVLDEIVAQSGGGGFDVLIVARLDRLTRNIRELDALLSTVCVRNGVDLVSIEEGLDTTSEGGRLALNIINIVTKWDTKKIPDRTREIIAQKRVKGERVGHAPFGYTYKNKKLVPVKKELETVALIREKRDAGMSYHKIARFLNDNRIASKRGGIWYAETVKTVYQAAAPGAGDAPGP